MTPLRQQRIRQMDLKSLSPHTRRSCPNAVNGLATQYRKSLETISSEMIGDCGTLPMNEVTILSRRTDRFMRTQGKTTELLPIDQCEFFHI